MLFVALSEIAQLSGLLCVITICFIVTLALSVLLNAIKKKNKLIFVFGIFLLAINTPWYPSGLGYIYWLMTGNVFDFRLYVLLGTLGMPIIILAWFYIYTTILYPNLKKISLISLGIFSLIFYIYLFYYLFFAPGAPVEHMIGVQHTPLDIEYRGFVLISIGVYFLIGVPTFLHFAISSMREKDNPAIQWRGKFLLIATILFIIGGIADGLLVLTPIFLIIVRIILLIAGFLFYIGLLMPDWVKKFLDLEIEE